MTTEIIKGAIAVIVFAAGVVSVFIQDNAAQQYLVPLATFVFGYYFKQSIEEPIVARYKAMRGK